jgi:hypothetical protein
MGLIAGFLSAVVGMSHVGGALSETNAENRWINPDKAANSINIPTDSTSPIIAAHALVFFRISMICYKLANLDPPTNFWNTLTSKH